MKSAGLWILLLAFWLALSGHYTPFLIAVGCGAALATLFMASRMGTIDSEGLPSHLFLGAMSYLPWLLWEIVKSAWNVTRIVLDPKLPISPSMTVIDASQRTAAGLVTFANSITLTPGTITIGVKGNQLTVHALVREGALDLEAGGMDRRVRRIEEGL
ncbi:MAG: Na+/H+ antiporter subunit E [Pseudomonadota bacterium]